LKTPGRARGFRFSRLQRLRRFDCGDVGAPAFPAITAPFTHSANLKEHILRLGIDKKL